MAYSINKTDGSILTSVADGQIDQFSTSLTLIGKNYSGFGEVLNENFIKLLENFANIAAPANPITGQLWFDTSENKIKVYNGTEFVPVSSATIADIQPSSLSVGDLWFDNINKQLFFYDGTSNILLGPDYSSSQNISGLKVNSILDTLNQTRVVVYLYANGVLLGIFSKDSFTPKNPIDGFSGVIQPGFNAGNLSGIKFYVTASNSDSLGGVSATTYLRSDRANIVSDQFTINSNAGLFVGDARQAHLQINNGNIFLDNISTDKNISLRILRSTGITEDAVEILGGSRTVQIYPDYVDSNCNVGGNLTVGGNITVRGTLTINDGDINVNKYSELRIEDRIIYLADTGDSSANSEDFADGGGIILRGGVDHELTYSAVPEHWFSSDNFNLATGKEYRINGVSVLTSTSLGPGITSIPGVTSFGTQIKVDVGPVIAPATTPTAYLRLQNSRISTLQGQNLELAPDPSKNIELINSPKITGLVTTGEGGVNQVTESPNSLTSTELSESTNKEYVLNFVRRRPIVLSLDISDGITNTGIATLLQQIAPPDEFEVGTIARILCTAVTVGSGTLPGMDLNMAVVAPTSVFDTPTGTASAVTSVSFNDVSLPNASYTISRSVKIFVIGSAGSWQFVS